MFPYSEAALAAGEESPSDSVGSVRDASYYRYTLHGIIAHSGAINSGHYYSFIKDSTDEEVLNENDKKSCTWTEFNDSRIAPFNSNEIPHECFGGLIDNENSESKNIGQILYKQHNAYMLVYRRTGTASPPSPKPRTASENRLYRDLQHDNMALLRDRQLLSK